MVAALIRPIFNAESGEQARELVGEAIARMERPLPKVAAMLERAEEDLLAFYAFPADHWRKLRSTDPLERLNREIDRRTDVVGIFPDDASLIRLATSLILVARHERWQLSSSERAPAQARLYSRRETLMTGRGSTLVVRTAVRADAPSVAAIGRVAFPAVHNDVVGPEFAAAVVEQTYSIEALTECITRCAADTGAEFLVAEQDGDVIGYLHYDSEGPEPELHRIYVDPGRKRGGVGSALMRELHARLPPGKQYVLFVAEANTEAQAFYQRHGLVVDRKVEGGSHLAIGIKVDGPPPRAPAVVMRYPASAT